MVNLYCMTNPSMKQPSYLTLTAEDFIGCFPHLKDKIPPSLEIVVPTTDIQAAIKGGSPHELYKRILEKAAAQGARVGVCHAQCALQMYVSHERAMLIKQSREDEKKSAVKIPPVTQRACLTNGRFDADKWCRREIDRGKAAMVIAAKRTAAFARHCCVRAYHACNRLTSNRSYSSFAVASSPVGSDSGGDDGGGSGDGDGQSDCHKVGAGHKARVDFCVVFQLNSITRLPGIVARLDALTVAGFLASFFRRWAA